MREFHDRASMVLSVAMVVIGVVIIARTISAGGGPTAIGIIMGVLFLIAGGGRLWVITRRLP